MIIMRVIGITGGVGAGKSTLLSLLEEFPNVAVIKADEVAKRLMKKGEIGYEKTVFMFGKDILQEDGEIDRKKLGDIVFKEKNKRVVLNGLVHPAVKNAILADINEKANSGVDIYFIEAAILLDDHYDTFCDEIWYVYSSESLRKQRLMRDRGYSEDRVEGIFASQMTDEKIRDKYFKMRVSFNNRILDKTDSLTKYKNKLPWVIINNNEGQLLTIEFDEALKELIKMEKDI